MKYVVNGIPFPEEVIAKLGDDAFKIAQKAVERAKFDLNQVYRWMPKSTKVKLLDIGAGLGLVAYFVAKCYPRGADLYLLDGKSDGYPKPGYHDEAAEPWRDVSMAKAIIEKGIDTINLPGDTRVFACSDPAQFKRSAWPELTVPPSNQIDLVISTVSWGHHYPIGEYVDEVKAVLKPEGRLILDIRKDTGGVAALEGKGFKQVRMIDTSLKCERWVFDR